MMLHLGMYEGKGKNLCSCSLHKTFSSRTTVDNENKKAVPNSETAFKKFLEILTISVPTFLGLLRDLTSQLGSKLASFQVLQ
ncbi:hypothetical protein STPL106120_01570 [Streptococcus pluranimalium]